LRNISQVIEIRFLKKSDFFTIGFLYSQPEKPPMFWKPRRFGCQTFFWKFSNKDENFSLYCTRAQLKLLCRVGKVFFLPTCLI